jgi:DNA primase
MAMLKPSCVRDLRTRVNLVDVISRTVTLRKAGSRFKGLCPFHQEKSPSFHVNPDMGVYKCFGCGKSGDLITFVRETEGLNFVEAVETLAQRYHIPLEYEEGRGPSTQERSLCLPCTTSRRPITMRSFAPASRPGSSCAITGWRIASLRW